MTNYTLTAEPRKVLGRKVNKLRLEGILPGNVFGKDVKSFAVEVNQDSFNKVYEKAGETGIIELTVGKNKSTVLVSNVQKHPVTGDIIHVDFRQIDLTKKITATVPVEVIGESPAEKSGIGTVVQQITELDVEALPADLPEKFELDVTELTEVDAAIFVKDLSYDRNKVTVDADGEQIVVKVEPPQKEEIVPEVVETPEGETPEGEATAEAPEQAPAAPSEGEPKEN
jgi:large subunit ribosomal protein L25